VKKILCMSIKKQHVILYCTLSVYQVQAVFTYIQCILIIIIIFSPTDVQLDKLNNNFKILH